MSYKQQRKQTYKASRFPIEKVQEIHNRYRDKLLRDIIKEQSRKQFPYTTEEIATLLRKTGWKCSVSDVRRVARELAKESST